ncbi:hypothetical protein EJ419_04280 [Alloscardovia theropitheci]|uniref:Uncharacterized protein n=1 Tax=Alloscardovia theropitheci TaxID=2496842 RepID=A0A4R0QPT9_9BIFI|nr:hypothetical protein [Alloscardovia theropitheci]TCD54263.1 hypothetical protein EJ419_04280 [Alloscardovia theropitheci]
MEKLGDLDDEHHEQIKKNDTLRDETVNEYRHTDETMSRIAQSAIDFLTYFGISDGVSVRQIEAITNDAQSRLPN